jgi:regulator of sigma E protease
MRALYFLVPFIVLVGVLIFVHELGHFLFLKMFGVKVTRFSLGFGPALLRLRRGETEYRVSAVPLGGYVKMLGEDPQDEIGPEDQGRAYHQKPRWQRAVAVLAGPAFNLTLPLPITFAFFAAQQTLPPATIGTVLAGSPAAEAGLLSDDVVVAVDGDPIRYWGELHDRVSESAGHPLKLAVERDRRRVELAVTPERHLARDRPGIAREVGRIGISPRFSLPQIGIESGDSPAAQAGLRTFDLVIAVNGRRTARWADLERMLRTSRGQVMRITYLRAEDAPPFADVRLLRPASAVVVPDPIVESGGTRGGWRTGMEPADLYVSSIVPGSPAARVGLRPGDRILRFDHEPVVHFESIELELEAQPSKEFHIAWRTPDGTLREGTFRQQLRTVRDDYGQDVEVRVFGARHRVPWRTYDPIPIEGRLAYATGQTLSTTADIVATMAMGFVHIARGDVPRDSVGGPIMIFYAAGVSAGKGLYEFLWMMALISINLGLLNLLPIPPLDGGQLLFVLIEAARRRPLHGTTRAVAHYAGLVLLIALMVFALHNDAMRFLPPR